MSSLTNGKRPNPPLTMGTHSGTFQADEALGVWLLRQLPLYSNSTLTRSRDLKVLETLDIVIDVGGIYDHEKKRYDHHMREFDEKFSSDYNTTKLSAAGLVYKHYGREIITELHPSLAGNDKKVDEVYFKMYNTLGTSLFE